MKALRTTATFGVIGASLVLSNLALADGANASAPATASAASTPAYSALPSGSMTPPPKDKAPVRVPKTEHVEGFAVADPPKRQLGEGGKITNVVVFASASDAQDYTAGKPGAFFGGRGSVDNVCFARRSQRGFVDEGSSEWAFDMEPTSRISAPWKPPPPPPKGQKPVAGKSSFSPSLGEMEVTAVHQEHFVAEGNKARIETTDAWIDPVTHGVRLIARSTLALERIGTAQGVTLFAARGDKALHVVARREKPSDTPEHPPSSSREFRMANLMRMPLMVQKSDGQTDASQCGFAHVSLKTSKGNAEMATFETQAIFVDTPDPKKNEKANDTEDVLKAMIRPQQDEEPEVRLRPLRATVSSTWGSKDKEPVISVSFGWAGRERQM